MELIFMTYILVLLDPDSGYRSLGKSVHFSVPIASFFSVPHKTGVILGNINDTNLIGL